MADTTSQKRKRENGAQNLQDYGVSSSSDTETKTKKVKTSSSSAKEKIKKMFKVDMPQDFYDFWEFCKELNPETPKDALLESIGLQLVGPYDVLAGGFTDIDDSSITSYYLHWRYYYDPPEFMTVIKGNGDEGYHIGYYRDEPKALPVFVGSNKAKVSCEFSTMGENIFAAVNLYLTDILKKTRDKSKQTQLKKLQASLSTKAKTLQYNMSASTPAIKARNKTVNSKTFHKAGIVVHVDESDVGYRPLTVTDGELRKMLKTISEGKNKEATDEASDGLQELLTFVQFANDECDYGMGLELGIDLFCFGNQRFHNTVLQLLPLAYQLLGRDVFAEITQVHLENRDRDSLTQI